MPFVYEVIVVAPERLHSKFGVLANHARIITDEEIIGAEIERFPKYDHQYKKLFATKADGSAPRYHDDRPFQ